MKQRILFIAGLVVVLMFCLEKCSSNNKDTKPAQPQQPSPQPPVIEQQPQAGPQPMAPGFFPPGRFPGQPNLNNNPEKKDGELAKKAVDYLSKILEVIVKEQAENKAWREKIELAEKERQLEFLGEKKQYFENFIANLQKDISSAESSIAFWKKTLNERGGNAESKQQKIAYQQKKLAEAKENLRQAKAKLLEVSNKMEKIKKS